MASIRCSACQFAFEVEDAFSGGSEFCPACGALNDVPEIVPLEQEFIPLLTPAPAIGADGIRNGLPLWLWWLTAIAVVAGFIWACATFLSGDWEQQHLQELAADANQANVSMQQADFPTAARQFGKIVSLTAGRPLESVYLRQLAADAAREQKAAIRDDEIHQRIEHAEQLNREKKWLEADAEFAAVIASAPGDLDPSDPLASEIDRARGGRLDAAAQAKAATNPSAPGIATDSSPDVNSPIVTFQRATEAFPQYIRAHPQEFRDDRGNWRRRQFIVWDVVYELQSQSAPIRMELNYVVSVRRTQPHALETQAMHDDDYIVDEFPAPVHCQSVYALQGMGWTLERQQTDAAEDIGGAFVQLHQLEQRAFIAEPSPAP